MTAISTCPDEHELLPVATGEPAGEAIGRHLEACPICRGRMDLLRAELAALRHDLGDGASPAGDAAPGPVGPEAMAAPAGTRSSIGLAEAPQSGLTHVWRARRPGQP
jgi:hypothetical protein